MAWATIRQATSEDTARLNAAASRFIVRYGVDTPHPDDRYQPEPHMLVDEFVDAYCEPDSVDRPYGLYLRRLWRKAVRRALRHPTTDGIAWGYVGYQSS